MSDQDKIVCKGSYFNLIFFGFIALYGLSCIIKVVSDPLENQPLYEKIALYTILISCTTFVIHTAYKGFLTANKRLTLHGASLTLKEFRKTIEIKISEIKIIQGVKRKASLLVQDVNGQEILIDAALYKFAYAAQYVLINAKNAKIIVNGSYFFRAQDARAFLSEHNIEYQE